MEARVLIIGGGVTGAGLARDLALRGVECLVVEKGDINAGASGANHGLLHSGARYVLADPVAARECRDESQLIKRLAPSCVEDTGGLFVAVPGDDEDYIANFPGLCETNGIEAKAVDCREALEYEPSLAENIIAAYRVRDASVNPFKLAIDNMAHAVSLGARLITYAEVVGFERAGGKIIAVRVRKLPGGEEFTVGVEQVVSASGAWTARIAALAGIEVPLVCSKGVILVTLHRVADCVVNRLRPPTDGDIIVPGGSVSLAGTTSMRLSGMDSFGVTFPEVDLLVEEAAKMIPSMAEVGYIHAFAGARSLEGSAPGLDDRALNRSFVILDHGLDGIGNFISVFGGKLTTFRLMAEKAADLVCNRLNVSEPCLTRTSPIPSSEEGRWIEPRAELGRWLRRHEPGDSLVCECEMVPFSAVNSIVERLVADGRQPEFDAISLRCRVGKGACQGAFCALRICGDLYNRGLFSSEAGIDEVRTFLENRWEGFRPVLWGRQMVQGQLQEAIYCGLFGLELSEGRDGRG